MSERNFTSELRKLRKSSKVASDNSSNDSLYSVMKKIREDAGNVRAAIEKTASGGGYTSGGATDGLFQKTADKLLTPGDSVSEPDIGEGARIKSAITNVLKNKYGEIGTKGLFDNIGDDEVERNIGVAKVNTLLNRNLGAPKIEKLPYYPNMQDGLTLFYAASEKGDKKAAKMAYEAAYTSDDEKSFTHSNYIAKNNDNNAFSYKDSLEQEEKKIPNYMRVNPEIKTVMQPLYDVIDFCKDNSMDDEDAKKIIDTSMEKKVSLEHAKIMHLSEQWNDVPEVKWTNTDVLRSLLPGGKDFLHSKKISYIKNYKDVISDAAQIYDIPPFLIAGVMYNEYGGDPMLIDDVAYNVRAFDWSGPDWVDENLTITKNPDLTSFGNTSIQVRRSIEMLGYDKNTEKRGEIIKSLKDPIQNIYMTACHLNELRNVDFAGKSKDELTEDEIKIIASRYNIGPEPRIDQILTQYGQDIYDNKDDILNALTK